MLHSWVVSNLLLLQVMLHVAKKSRTEGLGDVERKEKEIASGREGVFMGEGIILNCWSNVSKPQWPMFQTSA